MSLCVKVSDQSRHEMLADLCQRNTPCQLRYVTARRIKIDAKVRFLSLIEQRVVIDMPTVAARPVLIRPGEVVELFFLWKGQRFGLRSRVVGRTRWQVGKLQVLDALTLNYPEEIEKAQRRECYRLSLMHLPSAAITLREVAEDQAADPSAPINSEAEEADGEAENADGEVSDAGTEVPTTPPGIKGRMMNLSETGCGMVFEKTEARRFPINALYRACFVLPGDPEPFDFVGQIRWSRDHPAGDRIMVGIAWQLDPTEREHASIQTRLAKFIATEQREALRRARTADR